MRDYLVFGDVNSKDYDIYAANKNLFGGGEKRLESIIVPGRNGTLSRWDGTFENIEIPYDVYCKGEITRNIPAFRSRLAAKTGYCRLSDSFEPDIFMKARYSEKFTVDNYDKKNAAFVITFDCDPRRFLKSGERVKELTASAAIRNPTLYEALPLIRVYGTGTVTIGSVAVTVNTANVYTDIDCELQEAYKGSSNCNENITLGSGEFPTLQPGNNNIYLSGVTKIELTPRWWTR